MFTPEKYEKNCLTTDRLNEVYVPSLIGKMNWNFRKGKVLDYGSGPGRTGFNFILPSVVQTDSKMYNVDISPQMVEFSANHYHHERIEYAVGCFGDDSFPFSNIQFDKVFAINVFHFIRDIKGTMDGIIGVLKPGGQLGFTSTTCGFVVMQCLDEFSRSTKWAEYFADLHRFVPLWSKYDTHDDPEKFFRTVFIDQTGLKDVSLTYRNITLHSTMESAIDIAMSMNPLLPKIPEEKLSDLRNDYHKMIIKLLGVSSEATECDFPVEYVYGVLEKPGAKAIE